MLGADSDAAGNLLAPFRLSRDDHRRYRLEGLPGVDRLFSAGRGIGQTVGQGAGVCLGPPSLYRIRDRGGPFGKLDSTGGAGDATGREGGGWNRRVAPSVSLDES